MGSIAKMLELQSLPSSKHVITKESISDLKALEDFDREASEYLEDPIAAEGILTLDQKRQLNKDTEQATNFYEINNFQQLNNLITKEFKKVTLD